MLTGGEGRETERLEGDSLEREDQRRLLLAHARLEATLEEGLAHRTDAAARPPPCDHACAALLFKKSLVSKGWRKQTCAEAQVAPGARQGGREGEAYEKGGGADAGSPHEY